MTLLRALKHLFVFGVITAAVFQFVPVYLALLAFTVFLLWAFVRHVRMANNPQASTSTTSYRVRVCDGGSSSTGKRARQAPVVSVALVVDGGSSRPDPGR